MANLEDLSRMAMVEVDNETAFPAPRGEGWGRMALLLAASAAVCGLVVGLKRSSADEDSQHSAATAN
jgi:hypothetical protein